MTAAVTAVFGSLVLLMLGWIKLDLDRRLGELSARVDRLIERVSELTERVARIEGRLDEREHLT